jgi:NAD-dependent deacetylase
LPKRKAAPKWPNKKSSSFQKKATALLYDCDYFVVVGTSLQVYPAASLLYYAPPYLPKFIIDKKIPVTEKQSNLHVIEMPATEGMRELRKLLLK